MTATRTAYTDSLRFFGSRAPLDLIAEFGSPLYVYNEDILRRSCREMRDLARLPGFTASYSTKANANPHLLRIIREEGLHADAMSPGELAVLRLAGFTREEIFYVCNNVSREELAAAGKETALVGVDSLDQLEMFGEACPGGRVMVRINPGIGAGHHKKVITAGHDTKFGVLPEEFPRMRSILERHGLSLKGLNQHVGSLFLEPTPYLEAAATLLALAEEFEGLEVLDFGGGFGIPYRKYENAARLDLKALGRALEDLVLPWVKKTGYAGRFITEPGRYVAAECSLVLGTVHAAKSNGSVRYVGTDLGFTILARPMLYEAFHDLEVYPADASPREIMRQTVAGNICESGDILAGDRDIPECRRGDIIAALDAGAYGHSMSSNYNMRLRPAEVLIGSDGNARPIRRRDTVEDLLRAYL